MFGIGLPELIVILAVGLIVVGPEKMPELARSLAKGIVELKKAAGALRESLHEDDTVQDVNKVKDDITAAFQSLPPEVFSRDEDSPSEVFSRDEDSPSEDRDVDLPYPPDDDTDKEDKVIELEAEAKPDTEKDEKSA
jgi:sec-independent protein translocase protein TatB